MGGGTFAALGLGRNTLQAHRTAMDVVSHNMANSGVDGYSRQEAQYVAQSPYPTRAGMIGNGVDIARFIRHGSTMVERRLDADTSSFYESRDRSAILAQVEVIYSDESYSIGPGMTEFFNSWRSLSQNPASMVGRREVIARGQDVANRINSAAERLLSLRRDQDSDLTAHAQRVTDLADTVARLNREIQQAESGQRPANDLRDERQRAVRGIAELTEIHSYSDADGSILISLRSGASLVSGRRSGRLYTEPDPGNSGLMRVMWENADQDKSIDATRQINGGRMGGLLAARDDFGAGALDRLDRLAFDLAGAVNSVHADGFTLAVDPPLPLVPRTGQEFFAAIGAVSGAALAITVRGDLQSDPRLVAAAVAANTVPGDNRNALALADLELNAVIDGNTPHDYRANQVRRTGDEVSRAVRDQDITQARRNQTTNLRESISGVNIDQELSDLVKIQAAYEAAAKIVTTADEMLQTVLAIKR
jgi:flagellar hook-associated protein 1 FlgK